MSDTQLYKRLADFGRELLEKKTLAQGLPFIAEHAKELTGAQRASIFIYDDEGKMFWTTLADGVERIEVPADKGIVAKVFHTKKIVTANDLNEEPDFYAQIDLQTGFRTYNILAAPIYDSTGEAVGVLELLNKKGGFEKEDTKLIRLFAHSISSFVELIMLQRN